MTFVNYLAGVIKSYYENKINTKLRMSLTSSGKLLNLLKNKKLNSCDTIAARAARLASDKSKKIF